MARTHPSSSDPNSIDWTGNPTTDPGHLHSTAGVYAASGSLPTLAIVSGTAVQVDATSDRTVCQDTTTAGSAIVALSPDGVTYTNVMAVTTRATDCLVVPVPKGWYIKITLTTSTMTANATVY